jgi:hypothetical protein
MLARSHAGFSEEVLAGNSGVGFIAVLANGVPTPWTDVYESL